MPLAFTQEDFLVLRLSLTTQSISVFFMCRTFFILSGLLFKFLLLEQTSNTFRNVSTLSQFLLVLLPDIRTSDNYIDKNRPLPSSLQKDYIPDDILFALTQTPQGQELLGPSARLRNINTSTVRIKQFFEKVSFWPRLQEQQIVKFTETDSFD